MPLGGGWLALLGASISFKGENCTLWLGAVEGCVEPKCGVEIFGGSEVSVLLAGVVEAFEENTSVTLKNGWTELSELVDFENVAKAAPYSPTRGLVTLANRLVGSGNGF